MKRRINPYIRVRSVSNNSTHRVNSVVILDLVTYYTVLDDDDRFPLASWNESRIRNVISRWRRELVDWLINLEKQKTRKELLNQAKK